MVEVFKTNVTNYHQAKKIVSVIEEYFDEYKANFDIEDCDHILRIESTHPVEADTVICFLKDLGVNAEVLPDEIAVIFS